MTRYLFSAAAIAAVVLMAADVALAQTSRTGTTSGTSGTSQSTNQSASGSQAASSSQSPGATDANVGTITGGERFLRENRDPGQMVGGDVAGAGNLRGATDGGASTVNPFGSSSSRASSYSPFNSMFNQGMMNSMSRQRRQLRVPLRLGLDVSSPSTPVAAPVYTGPNTALQTRLTKIPQLKGSRSVMVEMEGRTAVLKGEVASQYQRDLAGKLVLLEPGIAAVRNELQVASAASPASGQP
jgi:hypothetical protein